MGEQEFQVIESYINGSLTEEETKKFEARVREDQDFANSVRLHIITRAHIEDEARKELKSRLSERFPQQEKGRVLPMRRRFQVSLAIAAVVSLIVAAFIWFRTPGTNYSTEELIAFNETELPAKLSTRGGKVDSVNNQKWEIAISNFEEENYAEAVRLLQELKKDSAFQSRNGSRMALFQGMSHIKLQEYQEAIDILREANRPGMYQDQIQWYLAVSYLQDNQIDQSIALLRMISGNTHHYKQESANLLLRNLENGQ